MTKARALVVSLLVVSSCLGWLWWQETAPSPHPWADLSRGSFTDHFSHMNAARAFARIGTEIYMTGPKDVYPAVVGPAWERLPLDVKYGGSWTGGIYALPGMRADKPWVTSWSDRPRLYPPGDLLLVAPVALIYDLTEISFSQACMLLILLFVIYAHASLYVGTRLIAPELKLATPVLWLCWALFYLELVHWALEGFYDVAVTLPLFLCVRYLRERRAVAAALAYCAAAFLHFRVFFLAPLALYAVYLFIADKQWRGLSLPRWLSLGACAALATVVLWVFWVLYPSLIVMPISNPVHLSFWPVNKGLIAWLVAIALMSAVGFAFARAWFDLAMLGWLFGMMVALREAQPWHHVVLLVWLLMPAFGAKSEGVEAVRLSRLWFLGFAAVTLLRSHLWPTWIWLLWRT